ncbi:MAG: methyltransferase [Clostridia bacterium]|jgi:TrmH family RNA methyltransferase|nr:methyltransferase [Clostridia bacterium]
MQNNLITSTQNPIIKSIVQLQKKKSVRKKENLFIVEGIKSVNEIPLSYNVKYYITTPHLTEEQVPALKTHKWFVVTDEIYKGLSETITPQGVMAVVEIPSIRLEDLKDEKQGFYLVLENLQDPGNLGTIIRTAHALGVKAVLLSKGSVDIYSPKVVRSTMGSLFHIPIIMDYEIEEYISYLKDNKCTIYATALEDAKPLFETHFMSPLAIVIGNEANGVSQYIKENADYKIMIPMPGGSESLNASIAASICIYEVMRQSTINLA